MHSNRSNREKTPRRTIMSEEMKTNAATVQWHWYIVFVAAIFAASTFITLTILSSVSPPSTGSTAQSAAAAAIDPFASLTLSAKSAYVLDLTTDRELYALHPSAQLPLASLTKIMLT